MNKEISHFEFAAIKNKKLIARNGTYSNTTHDVYQIGDNLYIASEWSKWQGVKEKHMLCDWEAIFPYFLQMESHNIFDVSIEEKIIEQAKKNIDKLISEL